MNFAGANDTFNIADSCLGAWEEKSTQTQELITSDAEKERNWKGDLREGSRKI